MPSTNGGNINFKINMTVDKSGLNQILKPLEQIQAKLKTATAEQLKNGLDKAANSAKQLESIINSSWNDKLGQLNLDKFNQSVKNSYGSVEGLKNSLSGAGTAGQSAFNTLASEVLNTNLQLKESSKLLDDMATSMANTIKWGITSSIFNNITGSIQKAYYYAKDLDTSLGNIRIVTGDSADQMERFAKTANEAAKNLGRSTLDYTNAALSFYQQGLSNEQVQARTEVTLKAQNITGTGSEMADYLTAVWNGFGAQAQQVEGYVDKLAKVADSSASDMSELAIAMSKVASVANTMGVDVDQLTAQLATVIATTRQAPQAVGTAFKTIYSRLNDIKAGADDAEISLGNYSGKMAELGFNVLDANGSLRDTGQVMEQIGSRWNTLSREQQVYLAQTMGGMRQVNQVMALFEGWATYSDLLNDSLSAQGSLNQKNSIYLETVSAQMKTLQAETERTYSILFDKDALTGLTDVFTNALSTFNDFIEGIGGGTNTFVNFGATIANVFNQQIGSAINSQINNIETLKNNLAQIKAQQEWSQTVLDSATVGHASTGDTVSQTALEKQAAITQRTLQVRKALTQEQYNYLQGLQREVGAEQTRIDYLSQYKTILNEVGISENASIQVIEDNLKFKQQQVELQKIIADYIQLTLIPSQQLTQAQRARIQIAQDILLTEGEEAEILVGVSSKQEEIVNKLQTEVLTDEELRDLLNQQNTLIADQQKHVNRVKQAAEGRKAVEDGTLQRLKNEQAARERIIQQQQDAAARQIAIQNAVRVTTGGIQALSSLMGGISTALDQGATASEKLNGVWAAGTGALAGIANMLAPGSGFLIQGLSGLIKSSLDLLGIWDNFENFFTSTEEWLNKIQEINAKSQQTSETYRKSTEQVKSLREEYDELSKKSGNFTEEQQTRYNELIQKLSQYNQDIIKGYDDRGNAIVANNNLIDETLKKLDQQYEKQMRNAYAGENLETIRHTEDTYKQNKEAYNTAKNALSNPLGNGSGSIANAVGYAVDELSGNTLFGNIFSGITGLENLGHSTIAPLMDEALEEMYSALQELDQSELDYTSKIEQAQKIIDKYTNYFTSTDPLEEFGGKTGFISRLDTSDIQNEDQRNLYIQTIQGNFEALKDFLITLENDYTQLENTSEQLQQKKEAFESSKAINVTDFFNVLKWSPEVNSQTGTTYNKEYEAIKAQFGDQWKEYGQQLTDSMLLSFLSGLEYGKDGQTFDEVAAAAQNLLAGFVDSKLFSTQALDGIRQQIEALQSQGLDKTGEQYKQRIEEIINNFLSTIDLSSFFEGMEQDEKEQNKQALEAFLKSLFDLSDIQVDVEENAVTDAVTEAAQKREEDFRNAQQAIKQFLSESLGYTSKNGANGRFGIGTLKNVFGEDTDLQNIDEIINQINWQHFLDYTEQGMAAGQALKKVWKEAQQINQDLAKTNSNLDFNTVFNSDAVIQNLEATKKLSAEEENYLATLQQRDKKLSEIAYHEGRNSENYIARLKEIAGSAQQLYIDRQNALKAQAIAEMETQQAIANNTEASEEERAAAQQIVIQKKEEILKLDYDIARAEQAILAKTNERAKVEYKNQKELLNKGKSALETLSGGGAITDSEQLLALAELENSNERLKQLGQSGNRNSEEYLNLLKEQLNVQAELVEQARLEQIEKAKTAIQESKIAQKEAERKLGSLQHNYDRAVGRGDDQAAAAILNQISVQEGIISSQKQTQVEKQAQLIGLQEQGKTSAESTAFSQQNRLQTLQTLSQTYKIISENLATGTFAQLGKQDIQLLTELESKNSNLAQIASTLGRNTQQYAEALRNAILIQQQADLANASENIKDVDSRIKNENDSYNNLSAEQQLNQKQEHQATINELLAERAGYLQDEYNIRAAIASLNNQRQADEDVKQEDLQQLTKYLYDYADAIEGVNDQVKENVEASADLAQAILRYDAALVQITSHYDDWEKQLTSGSVQEAAQAGEELQDVYSDLLDLPYENLSPDFTQSIDNLELLKQAANGSEQAYEALRQAAMEDILTQVGIDDASLAQFNTDLATIENEIANGIDDLEIGAYIDDTQAIQAMNELINAANLTAQQATDLLASMGVDAQVEQTTVPQNQKQAFISAVPTISSQPVDVPTIIPSFLGGIVGSTQVNVPTISYSGEAQTVQAPGEKTSTALRVTSAKKSSGGNFKFNQSSNGGGSRGRAARSPKRGGGGGKGKSPKKGGGSKAKTKEPKQQKALEDQQDRYHDINIEIKDIEKNLDKVQQVEKKLTGKDLIDNLNKQLDILDKQVDAQQRKLELQKQERDQLQNTLGNQGVTFNPDGTIANYATALSAKLAATNAAIAHYNTLSAEEQQKNKAAMEAAKQDYEKFKDSIERYDELISEEMPDLEKSIRQIRDQQIEKQIQKFKISVDLQLDTSQAERDFNAFKKKVIDQVKDDDVLANALYSFTDLSSYYKNGLDVIDSLTNQVNDTLGQLKEIDRNGEASVYGTDRAAALQDLKDYMDKLVDNLEDIEDLVDKIKDSIFDAIDVAQDSFDEQVNEYEYISDLIDHNVKMSQLLYGDDAYNTMAKYYQLQEKNNNNELDFLKQQKDLWFSRMVEQQTRMNNLDTGSRAFKQAEQRFEEYKQHWMDAVNDLNNKLEDSLKNIIDKYANAIDSTFDKLINKVTNNKGLDSVEEEWELINKQADMYLDTINSVNEINKLQIAYQDAINDNDGNLAAQKSLNNMMQEQLAYLRDKDKLTQYDVDRANALLQIEIKRLALQQQRQNKTRLRLRRDSQGNYTYQYTVDEQGLNDAKQELEEAEVSLYNMTKQAYKNNLDNYYDTVTDWQDKVKQVYKDTTLTVEQQQEKVAMLNKYYGDIINGLTQENENLKRFMMEDTFDELAKMYETNVDNYKAMTDAEKNLLMQDLIPYWNSGIQSMADVFAGQGGFIPVVNDTFNELADKTLEYQNSLDDLQNAAGADFNAINLAIDDTVYQAETLLDANNELINAYGEELDAVQRVVDQVGVLIDTYKTAKQAATAATTAAYKYWQQQHQNNARIAARQTVNSSSGRSSSSSSSSSSTSSSSSNNKNNTTNNAISSALNAAKSAASTALNAAKNAIQNSLNKTANTRKSSGGGGVNLIARLDSGGYTGSWGDSGKLAILHEKQIVLNKEDTSNILKSVSIVKTMDGLLENLRQNTLIKGFTNINGLGNNSNQTLDQQVHIQAHFPNVQNHSEIEQAFNNLVNRASQYAYRK